MCQDNHLPNIERYGINERKRLRPINDSLRCIQIGNPLGKALMDFGSIAINIFFK